MTAGRPLRVVHADHSSSRGGAEFALIRMLNVEHPWHATVLVPGRGSDAGVWQLASPAESSQVQFIGTAHTAGASRGGGILRFARQVLGQAVRVRRSRAFARADVLHANTSRAGLYCTLAAWGTRKPVVVHLRDLVDRANLGGLGYALTTRFVLPRASGVIANSRASLASARPFIRSSAVAEVIHSAIGILPTTEAPPIADEVATVGMVARLDTWKGQELLIRAFARAFPGDSATRLALAGSADFDREAYARSLEELASELGIRSRVDFLGHVDDVPGLIASWDVCVQASTRPEPLGQNVLQYLAAGRPTIATQEGGPGEWVRSGWNGWTFRMGDLESLAETLVAAKDPAARRRVAENAPQTPGLSSDAEVAAAHGAVFRAASDIPPRKSTQ